MIPNESCYENLNIQVAELYSIFLALFLWLDRLANKRVIIFTDNEAVMHMINKSSSSNRVCMIMIRYITLWCMKANTRVFAWHVPTGKNKHADMLSRGEVNAYLDSHKSCREFAERCRETLPDQF